MCITKNSVLLAARRFHDHEPHWKRLENRPLYDEEEDLDEYITINPNDTKQLRKMKMFSSNELQTLSILNIQPANKDY